MGLVGGPHCIAMCGAACAGIGQAAGAQKTTAMWTFQAGRALGYAGLGALAAASMQGLGWMTVQSAALRPVWSMFHVAMAVLGLVLGQFLPAVLNYLSKRSNPSGWSKWVEKFGPVPVG